MNIEQLLFKSELGSAKYNKINDFKKLSDESLAQFGKKMKRLYPLVHSLYDLINEKGLNLVEVKNTLEEISLCLNISNKFKDTFLSLKGHHCIRLLLIKNGLSKEILLLVLKVIKLLIPVPAFTNWVIESKDMVSIIYGIIPSAKDRFIMEEVIRTLSSLFLKSDEPFNLSKVQDLYNISSHIINNDKLYLYVRLLFTLCSDFYYPRQPSSEDPSSLRSMIKQKKKNSLQSIFDINQSIVLGLPNILKRLTTLIKNSTKANWVPPLIREDIIRDYIQFYNNDENNSYNHGILVDKEFDSPDSYKMIDLEHVLEFLNVYNIQIQDENVDLSKLLKDFICAETQTEMLFLLYLLLKGPNKYQVIKELNKLEFVDTLIGLIRSVDWEKEENKEESNPFLGKKMYIIDILLIWCDADVVESMGNLIESKYQISLKEENYIYHVLWHDIIIEDEVIEDTSGFYNGLNHNYLNYTGKNIIKVLYNAYLESFDFEKEYISLSYCIESMLRTWPNPSLQNFLIDSYLVDCLFDKVIQGDIKLMENTFDLLGELIKNNKRGFNKLNCILISKSQKDPEIERRFFTVLLNTLNCSNICLRSIAVSLFNFQHEYYLNPTSVDNYPISTCKIYRFFHNYKVIIFKTLLEIITPNGVTDLYSDNICCLNTALTFLLVSKRQNQSHLFFNVLHEFKIDGRLEKIKYLLGSPGCWRDFYASCVEERTKLVDSTFQFNEFCDVVDEILNF